MYRCSSIYVLPFNHLTGWKSGELSLGALAGGGGRKLWALAACLLLIDSLELLADLLDGLSAGSGDAGSITVVAVDTNDIGFLLS